MTPYDNKPRETPAITEPFTSYSVNCEDVILNRLFPQRGYGFYIDVGAGHPRLENDFYAFYERGWNGINVEPNAAFFALHEQIRPRDSNLRMVLSDSAGELLTYYEIEGSGLSTFDKTQAKAHAAHGRSVRLSTVPVSTLSDVLTEASTCQIDVLKVSVGRGYGEKVLIGNDWDRFRPSVVLVEANYPERRERQPSDFLQQRGYRHVYFDGLNDFYLEQSFPEPDGLTLPPNVFDHYVSREVVDLRDQIISLRSNFTLAVDNVDSLQTALAALQDRYHETLKAAESLTKENRRLGQQTSSLVIENRRWRNAGIQMQAEITILNRLLEPLHAMAEHIEHVRRRHGHEMDLLRSDMVRQTSAMQAERQRQGAELREMQAERQRQDAELREMQVRLQNVYQSRSWFLTRPWRAIGRLLKRLSWTEVDVDVVKFSGVDGCLDPRLNGARDLTACGEARSRSLKDGPAMR